MAAVVAFLVLALGLRWLLGHARHAERLAWLEHDAEQALRRQQKTARRVARSGR